MWSSRRTVLSSAVNERMAASSMLRADDGMLSGGVARRNAFASAAMVTAVKSEVVNVRMAFRAATGVAVDVGGWALGVGKNCIGCIWLCGTSSCGWAPVLYVPWGWSSRWTFRQGVPKGHEPRRCWRQLGGSQGPCTTGGRGATFESFTVVEAGGGRDGVDALRVASDAVNEVMVGNRGTDGEDGAARGDVDVVVEAAVNDGGLREAVLLASVTGGVDAVLALAAGVGAGAGDLKNVVMRCWLRPGVEACEDGLDGVRGGVAWKSPASMGVAEGRVGEVERGCRPRGLAAGEVEEAERPLGLAVGEAGDRARAGCGEGERRARLAFFEGTGPARHFLRVCSGGG